MKPTIEELRADIRTLDDVALTPEAKAAIIAALDVAALTNDGQCCDGEDTSFTDECKPVLARFRATIRPASGGVR